MVDSWQVAALQEIAAPRRGYFSTAEAAGIGIEWQALVRLARRGWVRRVRRGGWALAGAPGDRWEAMVVAAVVMGPGAALSHWSAAAAHGFDGTVIGTPELTVDARSRRRLDGVIMHRTGPLSPTEIVTRRGVSVTSPARTIVDLASRLRPDRLGAIIDEGIVRRMWTIDDIAKCLADQQRLRHGGAQLRELLALRAGEPVGDSPLEQRILRHLDEFRPFRTHHQVVVFGRLYVLDLAWPERRVGAEIDGRTYRTNSRTTFDRETKKLNDLAAANWLMAHLSAGMNAEECRDAVRRVMSVRDAGS